MMVNEDKRKFLESEFLSLARTIPANRIPRWGKMTAQNMIEHLSDFFKVSTDKLHFPLATPPEHLPKYREFLLSEKEFRENTKAPVLPAEPLPLRHSAIDDSLDELNSEVGDFFIYFSGNANRRTLHPAFGELNFEEWVQLHHKHVKHHMKQFDIDITKTTSSL
jgi:hypothetical protein